MEQAIKKFIRRRRRSPLVRETARLAQRFLNAYHNTGFYDFDENGEAFVLRTFARHAGGAAIVLWDVGAHFGEYAAAAHDIMPQARVISFEIVPSIADELRRQGPKGEWFELVEMGLSDRSGHVDVHRNSAADTINSLHRLLGQENNIETIRCEVSTIDELVARGMAAPTFLKIDVEGNDALVIDGARALLDSAEAPRLIQFEYGATWIPASRMLHQTQTLLESAGYSVGRLYSDHVEFKPYSSADEHFRMGNMVAVRDEVLRRALAA